MQHLKPVDYLIRYIMYIMENDIKIELVKNLILRDGLEVRLYQWYNENPLHVEGHLQLIPEDIKTLGISGLLNAWIEKKTHEIQKEMQSDIGITNVVQEVVKSDSTKTAPK